ncbi:MAG: APC family permease [Acidobacteriales bacterium]|nr:APC family permease [Terriglobales bacterium]
MTMPTNAAAPKTAGKLLRVLGVGFGLAVIIGNTIGAGILRTPGDVATYLPTPALFLGVWVVGGFYALLGAISLSELGTMLPRSGGYYVFARRALGEYAAFTVGWTDWLAQCGTTAAVAIVIAEYGGELFRPLAGHTVLTASSVTVAVAVLQWHGIRTGSMVQNVTTVLKTVAFLALVAAAFIFRHGSGLSSGIPLSALRGHSMWAAAILALQAVIYSYDGWYGVIYFGEEVRDPAHDIPRSMIYGVLSLTAIYLLVNVALLHVLSIPQIAGQTMALGTATAAIFGARGHTILQILMIVSMLSGINAYHLMASRIPFAMSKDGLLSRHASKVNLGGTPTVGLFLSTIVALTFILSGKFEIVLSVTAFYFVADYLMAYTAVFVLRWREPHANRPFRAWGYPWTTGLAWIGSLGFLVAAIKEDARNSEYALISLALSYPLYRLTRVILRRQNKTVEAA